MSRNAPSPEFGYLKNTGFLSFSHDFMSDRIMCVLVRIKVRGHFANSIIQFLNFISGISGHIFLKRGRAMTSGNFFCMYLRNGDVLFFCMNCTRGLLEGQLTCHQIIGIDRFLVLLKCRFRYYTILVT